MCDDASKMSCFGDKNSPELLCNPAMLVAIGMACIHNYAYTKLYNYNNFKELQEIYNLKLASVGKYDVYNLYIHAEKTDKILIEKVAMTIDGDEYYEISVSDIIKMNSVEFQNRLVDIFESKVVKHGESYLPVAIKSDKWHMFDGLCFPVTEVHSSLNYLSRIFVEFSKNWNKSYIPGDSDFYCSKFSDLTTLVTDIQLGALYTSLGLFEVYVDKYNRNSFKFINKTNSFNHYHVVIRKILPNEDRVSIINVLGLSRITYKNEVLDFINYKNNLQIYTDFLSKSECEIKEAYTVIIQNNDKIIDILTAVTEPNIARIFENLKDQNKINGSLKLQDNQLMLDNSKLKCSIIKNRILK